MATLTGELADYNMITDPGPGSGSMGRYVVWPGYIAFTGPGADTLTPVIGGTDVEHEPQLTVNETQTTANKLVLNSYKAGRVIIRIEPSQFTPKKGT